jgi:hypothetical protein
MRDCGRPSGGAAKALEASRNSAATLSVASDVAFVFEFLGMLTVDHDAAVGAFGAGADQP